MMSEQRTPYAPGPGKNGNGCTDVNDTDEARDKGRNVQWGDTVAESTQSLEERASRPSQNRETNGVARKRTCVHRVAKAELG